jgi:hypothetical protein
VKYSEQTEYPDDLEHVTLVETMPRIMATSVKRMVIPKRNLKQMDLERRSLVVTGCIFERLFL